MINEEQKKIIEKFILENPHYQNNKDLFGAFCTEVFNRMAPTLEILKDKMPPQNYIDKVVKKSILHVLKENQRLSARHIESEPILENLLSFNINKHGQISFNIPFPSSERESISVIEEQIEVLLEKLYRLNDNEPEKQFSKIFDLHYNQKLKFSEIAQQMNISEDKLSQRFYEMLLKLNDC